MIDHSHSPLQASTSYTTLLSITYTARLMFVHRRIDVFLLIVVAAAAAVIAVVVDLV